MPVEISGFEGQAREAELGYVKCETVRKGGEGG
jgi:hypothetical protein